MTDGMKGDYTQIYVGLQEYKNAPTPCRDQLNHLWLSRKASVN